MTEPKRRGSQAEGPLQYNDPPLNLAACPGLDKQVADLAATAARVRMGLSVARDPVVMAEQLAAKEAILKLPQAAQLRHAAAMLADMDAIACSWVKFPFYELELDTSGKPAWVSVFGAPPVEWSFVIEAGKEGGLLITAQIPASAGAKLKAHPLWVLTFPNASFY
ncbi:hypothetical protein WJX72_011284 [[Myrmecia] bisecta]|uniref:Uncharacterized protein n=1 Tax=[Myrmecia] bisecta TaxID=41462 RepID=A0AAW1Q5B8_9CHLO